MASITDRSPPLDEARKRTIDEILRIKESPVARCRLLSGGMEPYHRLYMPLGDEITGDKGCLACGNCVDSCPVLRREPGRFALTDRRTSFALESMVGEDCESCFSCLLACPQVNTEVKDYVVDEKIPETIPQSGVLRRYDSYLMAIAALLLGIVLGVFVAR